MKQSYFILLIVLVISCKKETTPVLANTISVFEKEKLAVDTLLISKYNSKMLMDFYKNYSLETVWETENIRNIILSELSNSKSEGLEPNDYHVKKLSDYESQFEFLVDTARVNYDLLLTNSLQNYLSNVINGKLNPKIIYPDWDLKPKELDINQMIYDANKTGDFAYVFAKIKPDQPVYKELKNALKIIDSFPQDYFVPIKIGTKSKISLKQSNPLLIPIKKRLIYWKYLSKKDTLTKVYDQKTVDAIKEFQENNGLLSDGIIGSSTVRALNFYKSERREQIIANMERWRWFPDSFGNHYTLVNIPEYCLKVIKDSIQVDTFNVIVGTDKRRSPVFATRLNQVVFCPTWTVPPTIIKEDLLPDATKNRGYFNKMHIKIYNYKKKQINPWEWKPEDVKKYDYVQDPGKNNSLGHMKILFPNKFSVYLHDTNHKDGFSRNFRSLSSGCTRVEDPLRLAQYVLNDSINYCRSKIDTIVKKNKTIGIKIKQEIKHYQLYWTAWSKKNRLCFRDDVYNLDADLYCRLRHQK
jgi:L,D-transpeptidase YcbB